MNLNDLIGFGIVLLPVIAFLAVGRELVCWYFKINERVKAQHRTNDLLERQNTLLNQSGTLADRVSANPKDRRPKNEYRPIQ